MQQQNAAPIASRNSWSCAQCTFINPESKTSCKVCTNENRLRKRKKTSHAAINRTERPAIETKLPTLLDDDSQASFEIPTYSSLSEDSENEFECLKRRTNDLKTASINGRSHSTLWTDKYAPTAISQVCVQKRKCNELYKWIEENTKINANCTQKKRLLILSGPSGCGKSTLVQCIARTLALNVRKWKESPNFRKYGNYTSSMALSAGVSTTSIDEFTRFLTQATTLTALPLYEKGRFGLKTTLQRGQMTVIEYWPQFMRSKYDGSVTISSTSIIQTTLNQMMNDERLKNPIILIHSNVRDRKPDLSKLKREFGDAVVSSSWTSIMHINRVTTVQLRRKLQAIAKSENLSLSVMTLEGIIAECNGDMRHAINMLQLRAGGNCLGNKTQIDVGTIYQRDLFHSDLRLVGKLLHGKTLDVTQSCLNDMEDFPELEVANMVALLHQNISPYYTAIEELSRAMDLLSFSHMMVRYHLVYSHSARKISREALVLFILTRTVRLTNLHPSQAAFRSITGCKHNSVAQRIRQEREALNTRDVQRDTLFETDGRDAIQYACARNMYINEIKPFENFIFTTQNRTSNHSYERLNEDANTIDADGIDVIDDDEWE